MLPLRDHLPTQRTPVVTYLLIAVNVLAFLWERSLLGAGYPAARLVYDWGLVPARFLHAPGDDAVTLFTSMFLHDPSSWWHLGGNMLFLWIFGDNVEDAMGSLRFLGFYLLSGVAAAAGQILIDPSSHLPMVGASGAIAGVLAAYGSLYPLAPVTLLNPVLPLWLVFGPFIELPAWMVILWFFALNLFDGLLSIGGRVGGVAFFAHLGGFVAGLLLVRLFMQGRQRRDHERWQTWRPPPRARPLPPPRDRGPWGW